MIFLYEARAEIRAPDHKLAEIISRDYRNARDEFTRHDLFQKIKPVITKRITEAGETKLVLLALGGRLKDYDFDKKAFPSGFGEATFIPYKDRYAVTFANAKDITHVAVALNVARSLAGELRRSRRARFMVYGKIVDAKEKDLNFLPHKVVDVKVTKIEILLESGTNVGSQMF